MIKDNSGSEKYSLKSVEKDGLISEIYFVDKNGSKQGKSYTLNNGENLVSIGNYVDGKLEGDLLVYHANGNINYVEHYKSGKLESKTSFEYLHGNIYKMIKSYKDKKGNKCTDEIMFNYVLIISSFMSYTIENNKEIKKSHTDEERRNRENEEQNNIESYKKQYDEAKKQVSDYIKKLKVENNNIEYYNILTLETEENDSIIDIIKRPVNNNNYKAGQSQLENLKNYVEKGTQLKNNITKEAIIGYFKDESSYKDRGNFWSRSFGGEKEKKNRFNKLYKALAQIIKNNCKKDELLFKKAFKKKEYGTVCGYIDKYYSRSEEKILNSKLKENKIYCHF